MADKPAWGVFEKVDDHNICIGMFNTEQEAKDFRIEHRGTSGREVFITEMRISVPEEQEEN